MYYESYEKLEDAIYREKQLKKWHRDWKEKVINEFNPEWRDLAVDVSVDEEYLQAVKSAYECGQYVAGSNRQEIAGQAHDEGVRDEEE